jgi:hypothetical protein
MHSADLKTSTARTIKLDDGPLRIEDIIDIAEGSARVVLSDSHEFCAGIARGRLQTLGFIHLVTDSDT